MVNAILLHAQEVTRKGSLVLYRTDQGMLLDGIHGHSTGRLYVDGLYFEPSQARATLERIWRGPLPDSFAIAPCYPAQVRDRGIGKMSMQGITVLGNWATETEVLIGAQSIGIRSAR